MKLIFSILILLSISFNVHSIQLSERQLQQKEELCHYIIKDFNSLMIDFNLSQQNKSEVIRDLRKGLDSSDTFVETEEHDVLIEKLQFERDWIESLFPELESHINIMNGVCKD